MKNVYKVNYKIFFIDDPEPLVCCDIVRAKNEAGAVDDIKKLFDTSETTTRIDSIEFVA